MFESKSNLAIQETSPKSFGVVFSIVFLIVALYPLISSENVHLWALFPSLIFLILAYLAPEKLTTPSKLWFKLGILLGSIIAPIIMALVYFFTVLPIGLIMRLLGKDLLKQKLDKSTNSYWIHRNDSESSMKNQF